MERHIWSLMGEKNVETLAGGVELMALIKCENVSIGYEGQMVVHDLNFGINLRNYLCIVGENSSEKVHTCKESFGTEECGQKQDCF